MKYLVNSEGFLLLRQHQLSQCILKRYIQSICFQVLCSSKVEGIQRNVDLQGNSNCNRLFHCCTEIFLFDHESTKLQGKLPFIVVHFATAVTEAGRGIWLPKNICLESQKVSNWKGPIRIIKSNLVSFQVCGSLIRCNCQTHVLSCITLSTIRYT